MHHRLRAAARAATLPLALTLPGCATTPGCRWHVILEPRVTASADGRNPVRPIGSVSARPVCVAPRQPTRTPQP